MLRTASSLPLSQGFRHWASTPDVSLRRCQPATGPPDSYPDRTHTGRRRRAYEHEDQLPKFTASPLALLDALHNWYRFPRRSASNRSIVTPSTPAAPLFSFTFNHASHTSRFGMSCVLPCNIGSVMWFIPFGWPHSSTRATQLLGSTRI